MRFFHSSQQQRESSVLVIHVASEFNYKLIVFFCVPIIDIFNVEYLPIYCHFVVDSLFTDTCCTYVRRLKGTGLIYLSNPVLQISSDFCTFIFPLNDAVITSNQNFNHTQRSYVTIAQSHGVYTKTTIEMETKQR